METQSAVLNVMTDLRQQPNTPEQNVTEQLSQKKFNQRSHNYRKKDQSRVKQRKRYQEAGKEKKTMYMRNLHEDVTESDLVERFGKRTANYLIDNCSNATSNNKVEDPMAMHLFQYLVMCVMRLQNCMAWNFKAAKLLFKKLKHHLGHY